MVNNGIHERQIPTQNRIGWDGLKWSDFGSLFLHLGHVLFLPLRQQVLELCDLQRLGGAIGPQLLQLLLSDQQLIGRLERRAPCYFAVLFDY